MNPIAVYAALELIEDVTLRNRVLDALCADDADTRDRVLAMFGVPEDTPDPTARPAIDKIRRGPSPKSPPLDSWHERERLLRALRDGERPLAIGHYDVLERVGRGSVGTVFRVVNPLAPQQPLAIKFLTEFNAITPDAHRRWDREIRVIRSLDHPNLIEHVDSGVTHGTPWVVMPLCDAGDLARHFERSTPMTIRRSVRLADKILAGMAHAHARGVIHRDLKPANVLLHKTDKRHVHVKIADFGLAKSEDLDSRSSVTKLGDLGGTLGYMAPEQAEGLQHTSARSDVWSIAAIVYESLTGERPRRQTLDAPLHHQFQEVRACQITPIRDHRSDIPPALDAWLSQCLARDPVERFADAGVMRAALSEGTADIQ